MKRSSYSANDLAKLDASLSDYFGLARASETETINDLEKHLWLANGAAATASIAFIQTKAIVPIFQYVGAWAFVTGILMLVVMKYVSASNFSRDRVRFQDAQSRFDADEVTDNVFRSLRDKTFHVLRYVYLVLQRGAGVMFIVGSISTLVGVASAV